MIDWLLKRWRQSASVTQEAKDHLERITCQEPRIQHLSAQLSRARDRNHFSEMVNTAISRTAREGEQGVS